MDGMGKETFAKFFENKLSDWQCVEGAVLGTLASFESQKVVGTPENPLLMGYYSWDLYAVGYTPFEILTSVLYQ